jgi:hypothetical protein
MSEAGEQDGTEVEEVESIQPEQTSAEDVARKGGWRPESEWEQDDPKRPDTFSSAEMFNARGEFIGRIKAQDKRLSEMESSFNTRLENSNLLHKAQLDSQKKELIRKRDAAIDLADREGANQFQGEIDNLVTPDISPAPVSNDQTFLDNWNKDNPWILQNTPKAAYATSQFVAYQNSGQDARTALANAERDIQREFPDVNLDRNRQPTSEGGSKPGGKRGAKALTMADTTEEERRIYRAMPDTWKTEKDFLKACQDSRS